jgi:predicted acylesterase/phospholipase RssA
MPGPELFDVAFRGGGMKGVAYVGALEKLLEGGKRDIRRLVGSSAGAIFATCLTAGYSSEEMREVVFPKKGPPPFAALLKPPGKGTEVPANVQEDDALRAAWEKIFKEDGIAGVNNRLVPFLLEGRLPGPFSKLSPKDKGLLAVLGVKEGRDKITSQAQGAIPGLASLALAGAACDDKPFVDWMAGLIRAKLFRGEDEEVGLKKAKALTLKQFHQQIPKKDPLRQLSLVATDTDWQRLLLLNDHTAPRLPVVRAVRMSMSIPFVWPEVVWQCEWGDYPDPVTGEPTSEVHGHRIVDGGVLSNFPLRFLLDKAREEAYFGKAAGGGPKVSAIGLLLDSGKVVPERPSGEERPPRSNLVTRSAAYGTFSRLLETLTDSSDNETVRQHEDKVCRIGTKGFHGLNFDMSRDDLERLVNSGRCAMSSFLASAKRAP